MTERTCCDGKCLQGRDCPRIQSTDTPMRITMHETFLSWLQDLICSAVWWIGTVGLIVLIFIAAGFAFGLFSLI
jgi:hypothetical protein